MRKGRYETSNFNCGVCYKEICNMLNMLRNLTQLRESYESVRASVTGYHRLGDLSNRNSFLPQFWRSEVHDQGVRFSFSWAFPPWAVDHPFLTVSSRGLFSGCAHPWRLLLLLYGHESKWFKAPPLRPHLSFMTSLKAPSPKTVTVQGWRLQHMNWGRGAQFNPQIEASLKDEI